MSMAWKSSLTWHGYLSSSSLETRSSTHSNIACLAVAALSYAASQLLPPATDVLLLKLMEEKWIILALRSLWVMYMLQWCCAYINDSGVTET